MADGDHVRFITLKTKDGKLVKADFKAAMCSKTIKGMYENLGAEDDDDDQIIPVSEVDEKTLVKVLEWAEHYKDHPAPTPEEDDDTDKRDVHLFRTWDAQFLKVDEDIIYDLTLAANYLEIDDLLNVTCKVLANMLRGKTPEWCREHFGIVNDFTDAQLEQIRKENEWCDDK